MSKGEHKTLKGLLNIVSLKASLNLGLSDSLKAAYPNVIPAEILLYNLNSELEPYWITGFLAKHSRVEFFYIPLWTRSKY